MALLESSTIDLRVASVICGSGTTGRVDLAIVVDSGSRTDCWSCSCRLTAGRAVEIFRFCRSVDVNIICGRTDRGCILGPAFGVLLDICAVSIGVPTINSASQSDGLSEATPVEVGCRPTGLLTAGERRQPTLSVPVQAS